MDSPSNPEIPSSSPLSTKSIDLLDGTTVSYVCIPPSDGRKASSHAAVVHFGPLSGCSASTLAWGDLWQRQCVTTASLITVDRPGCHETSPVPEEAASSYEKEDWVLRRMRFNTRNVIAVLQAEEIDTVYILAVCLGHAYAIHFARELLHQKSMQLKDISLVAPFVSTACPHTWSLARVGNSVPSFLLTGATDVMVAVGATLTPWFLNPSAVKNMLSADEQADWSDPDDYEYTCKMVSMTAPLTRNVRAVEARFGSSAVWQQVVDEFAQEAGYGLQRGDGGVPELADTIDGCPLFPRIKLHVSPNDSMVTVAAADWLAQRCYADCDVVLHKEMSSHLTMTLLGGPPRNPLLLRHISEHEFGILKVHT